MAAAEACIVQDDSKVKNNMDITLHQQKLHGGGSDKGHRPQEVLDHSPQPAPAKAAKLPG